MSNKYPVPDRSGFTPNFTKTEENDVLDIGWAEGTLSDGRPYRFECWCQDQVTAVTIFLSATGLQDLDDRGVQNLLEKEDLLHFPFPKCYVSSRAFRDPGGNDLLSINVVIGDEEQTYASGGPALHRYPRG